MKQTNENTVKDTLEVLSKKQNNDWIKIYQGYAEQIIKNKKKYGTNSSLLQAHKPLIVYSSIGKVKTDSQTTLYDLRFAGQSVGLLQVDKDKKVLLTVTDEQSKYAKYNFGFIDSAPLNKVGWKDDINANKFKQFYSQLKSTDKIIIKSPEHRIESEMLLEFGKARRKEDKKLCNIQPVRLGGKFFQLTTPLKGSTHIPTISLTQKRNGATGGGIDILARIRHPKTRWRLAVIELKDQNRSNESQKVAMFQALIYATFIASLLRSDSGKLWWYLFRDNYKNKELNNIYGLNYSLIKNRLQDVPQKLDLDVITLMPIGESEEGHLDDIDIPELNTTLHLYTLYYDTDINGNPCSFAGTLTDAIKK